MARQIRLLLCQKTADVIFLKEALPAVRNVVMEAYNAAEQRRMDNQYVKIPAFGNIEKLGCVKLSEFKYFNIKIGMPNLKSCPWDVQPGIKVFPSY